jgi:hypothetical protein
MPVYSFADKDSGDEFELTMSYDEMLKFLEDNSQLNQTFRMNIGDPIRLGVTKPPSDFSKYVLGKVKENNPLGKAIERRYTIPKEI